MSIVVSEKKEIGSFSQGCSYELTYSSVISNKLIDDEKNT